MFARDQLSLVTGFFVPHTKRMDLIRLLLLTLTIITASGRAKAERYNQGLGVYGLMHKNFPCRAITEGFKGMSVMRLSILWHTFGESTRCLDQWALDPRPKFLQVHTINEVCHRNKRCGRCEILRGVSTGRYQRMLKKNQWTLKPLGAYLAPLTDWLNSHPDVQCSISMGLESNLPRSAYQKLVDMSKPFLPTRCSFTWNPANNNPYGRGRIHGMIHELHGSRWHLKPPCIANLDGEDMELPNRNVILRYNYLRRDRILQYIRKSNQCLSSFLWIPEFNGNKQGGFKDPRRRSGWPSKNTVKELNRYLKR